MKNQIPLGEEFLLLRDSLISIRELRQYASEHEQDTQGYWIMVQSADLVIAELEGKVGSEETSKGTDTTNGSTRDLEGS
jgi:hypothetical protein